MTTLERVVAGLKRERERRDCDIRALLGISSVGCRASTQATKSFNGALVFVAANALGAIACYLLVRSNGWSSKYLRENQSRLKNELG